MDRIAEIFLFDTCTHKCAYCHFAETGKVLDASQLRPYRDPAFIDHVVNFFNSRTTAEDHWLLTLTGGEPLLMPNLTRFARGLWERGNKVAFYTAMLVGENHPSIRFLLEEGSECTDYLMCSFHPEAEEIEDKYFARLAALKKAGHSVIFRLVGHPFRLHRLDELAARCRDIDVAFHPTPLFSANYPANYTDDERRSYLAHVASLSQLIQLEGGVDTTDTLCSAGSKMIAVDMRTGNIVPCVTVHEPNLGNIYDGTLRAMPPAIYCPKRGTVCGCDVHFQQDIVKGAADGSYFAAEKRGYAKPIDPSVLLQELAGVSFKIGTIMGATTDPDFLALDTSRVKAAHEQSKAYFSSGYAERNHPFFKSRQFAD